MIKQLATIVTVSFSILSIQAQEILNPVVFNEVTLEDNFWLPRLQVQKRVLVPFALEKTKPAVENLQKTANFLKGIPDDLPFPHRFVSSDLYKVMEGAAYLLELERDPALEKEMDRIIDIIAEAQQKDGYNYESHITGVSKGHENEMGATPYSFVVHSHELYNMGHMYEGAIAYYQATGKDKWLKVAEANARHINKVFFEGDPNYNNGRPVNQAPGHEEIELAVVKMFRVTGDSLYLQMSKKFLDIRGVTYRPEGTGVMSPEYAQQHLPVREQTKAVGHAVRATYLYSGMADVSVYMHDPSLRPALDSIWHNIVDTRMHITGGLGAVHGIEGFGPEYELPNLEAFDETCAAVGNVFFNHRMFLMERDGKYMDVAEVALLNNVLAGVNLEGNKFFYLNPLEADGIKPFNHGLRGRSPWFGTACCPSNLARLIPQVPSLMYATMQDEIYCSFYAGSSTTLELKSGKVQLKQTTEYPFSEQIHWVVTPDQNGQKFVMKFRIPTWTGKQFVPGELYSYIDSQPSGWSLSVNGKKVNVDLTKGFASIDRTWKKGDVVELYLPMPLRFSKAIDQVEADRGRVSLTKGPLVYCAEGIDNADRLPNVFIKGTPSAENSLNSQLNNIPQIKIAAWEKTADENKEIGLTLLPYYAWDNRGDGSMMVWFPESDQVQPFVDRTLTMHGKFKNLEASYTNKGDHLAAVADNQVPTLSADGKLYRWTSWGEQGKNQWIAVTLDKPTDIQSVSVFWTDDNRGVRIPKEWSLEYDNQGQWIAFPLYVTDAYNTFKDQFNMVHPGKQILTTKIRLLMKPQTEKAVGVFEINIDEVK
ncbi:beta-L-arabinofuranosidase domain-containing protein [Massilibacteroides sp.]|uniref:glycoside hydrolase family 127 protein n=1 Tax=Massilibacteroides sp. TaxID=2034766 RepID=UPI00260A3EF8|nr:beta-L-arabinofuranosidase domain-containing protein [Massilibacteroides sp.]MDD4515854.1 glycoside hydrolase family 127 protein [Massilibacteroides sp.]